MVASIERASGPDGDDTRRSGSMDLLRTCSPSTNTWPNNMTMLGLAWELDPHIRPNCYCNAGGPGKALPGMG